MDFVMPCVIVWAWMSISGVVVAGIAYLLAWLHGHENQMFRGRRPITVFLAVLAWPVMIVVAGLYHSPRIVRWLFTPIR